MTERNSNAPRIFVIGVGMVGASAACSLIKETNVSEIALMDVNEKLLSGQILDLKDASAAVNGPAVTRGEYSNITSNDIVIVASGRAQKEGESRLELLNTNANICRSVLTSLTEHIDKSRSPIVIFVANPVDVLTTIAVKEFGLQRERVFGSGTFLDSIRLRRILTEQGALSDEQVQQAWVVGEHGDTSVSIVPGQNSEYEIAPADIGEKVRRVAAEIIKAKGSTYFGIGSVVGTIVNIILNDHRFTLPLSVYLTGEYGINGVAVGVPAQLGRNGIEIGESNMINVKVLAELKSSAQTILNSLSDN